MQPLMNLAEATSDAAAFQADRLVVEPARALYQPSRVEIQQTAYQPSRFEGSVAVAERVEAVHESESRVFVETIRYELPVVALEPKEEDIRPLAYSYYVSRGYLPGDEVADWYRAVAEIRGQGSRPV